MNRKRTLYIGMALLLLAGLLAVPGIQFASGSAERLVNGNFEGGFEFRQVGAVPRHWQWFHNGGRIRYGFYDETWAPVIYDGQHSLLIELNTHGPGASDADRYAGIYQTVAVVPGESYELSLHGMLRALEDDPDRSCCNYRVQYGIDYNGGSDWALVSEWYELPWNTVHPRLSPGSMESYSTSVKATTNRMTVYIRVWKKWGTVNRELDVNLDAISLKGAMPPDIDSGQAKPPTGDDGSGSQPVSGNGVYVNFEPPKFPVQNWEYTITVDSSNDVGVTRLEFYDNGTLLDSVSYDVGPLSLTQDFLWKPTTVGVHKLKAIAWDAAGATATHKVKVRVGTKGQFLANGDFEGGFYVRNGGAVGNHWTWFHNGGPASYGFYDETWAPVIYDGRHSQLIEINTYGRNRSDPDRHAGIYQSVTGLTPGATYRFKLRGMLRVQADDSDRAGYNYRVQWGYTPDGSTNWQDVQNWVEIPWDTVYTRLEPGAIQEYITTLEAPSSNITVFIRAWKKWGTVQRELDVNLDGIKLAGYQ